MKDNLNTNVPDEAETPAFLVGDVSRSFTSEELYGLWESVDAQRKMICDKQQDSTNVAERFALAFTANCLGGIMDEIAEMLEPSKNCG